MLHYYHTPIAVLHNVVELRPYAVTKVGLVILGCVAYIIRLHKHTL